MENIPNIQTEFAIFVLLLKFAIKKVVIRCIKCNKKKPKNRSKTALNKQFLSKLKFIIYCHKFEFFKKYIFFVQFLLGCFPCLVGGRHRGDFLPWKGSSIRNRIGLETSLSCTRYQGILNTVQCTQYTVQCTLYIVHCTLYTVHCTLYSVQNLMISSTISSDQVFYMNPFILASKKVLNLQANIKIQSIILESWICPSNLSF